MATIESPLNRLTGTVAGRSPGSFDLLSRVTEIL
jgi:hypothetical protein